MKDKTRFFSALLFCTVVLFIGYAGEASALTTCTSGPVASPGAGDDLLVTGSCTVGAGTYHYGNVNIIGGGTLEFKESINAETDFWAKSILDPGGK
jgi:hypothetical protein